MNVTDKYFEALTEILSLFHDVRDQKPFSISLTTGSKIRSIRKWKKIRTSELAKACGVSESEMRHLENGTRIITDVQIEKAAEYLNVPPSTLCD